MKKLGTPMGAGPGVAREKMGLAGVGAPFEVRVGAAPLCWPEESGPACSCTRVEPSVEGVGVPGLPGRCVCDGDCCDGVVCDGLVWLGVVWLGVEELGGCVPCWGGRVGVGPVCVGRSGACTDATRFAGAPVTLPWQGMPRSADGARPAVGGRVAG